MEKKNTLLLTVIAIATLLVAVVGATFAYFATTVDSNGTLNVTAVTDPAASVFLSAGEELTLNITSETMQKTAAVNVADSQTKNLVVIYGSSKEEYTTSCTYDIVFAWNEDSESKYLSSTATHPTLATDYTGNTPWYASGASGAASKEFTITVGSATASGESVGTSTTTGMLEKNIGYDGTCSNGSLTNKEECEAATETWSDGTTNYMTLVEGAKIESSDVYNPHCTVGAEGEYADASACGTAGGDWVNVGTTVTWPITISFYNLNTNQNHLAGHTYAGKVQVTNVVC